MIHRRTLLGVLLSVTAPSLAAAQGAQPANLYNNPPCPCCDAYAAVLPRRFFFF